MAQKRMLSKRVTESDKIIALEGNNLARFLYTALLPHTDKAGRVTANPLGLKGTIFEAFEYTVEDITGALQALSDVGLLVIYRTKRRQLVAEYVRFTEFNSPHKNEADSNFSGPREDGSEAVQDVYEAASLQRPDALREDSGKPSEKLPVRGKEWRGEEESPKEIPPLRDTPQFDAKLVERPVPPNPLPITRVLDEARVVPDGDAPPEYRDYVHAWLHARIADIDASDMSDAVKRYTRKTAERNAGRRIKTGGKPSISELVESTPPAHKPIRVLS